MSAFIAGRFNFEFYPKLLKIYKEYSSLRLKATDLSRKEAARFAKKYQEAADKRDAFARDVVAKEIYEIFNPLQPMLTNADKQVNVQWVAVFDKPFDQLTDRQKYCLVGLVDGNYVYELPIKYSKY